MNTKPKCPHTNRLPSRQVGRPTFRKPSPTPERAFTFTELMVVLATLALTALMVLPARARTRNGGAMAQCQNNLRQLTAAWMMYSADHQSRLVASYPTTRTWCAGNASSGGYPGAYAYGGADPGGITNGMLWSYVRSLGVYKCPTDKRVSQDPNTYPGQPILRSVAMNSYLAGTSFGVTPVFTITNPGGARNANTPVFVKESEITRPAGIWVIVDEDPDSINDGMFLVDLGGSLGFMDLPSRAHGNCYGISFADGHTDSIELLESGSLTWSRGSKAVNSDWQTLTNLTTAPLY